MKNDPMGVDPNYRIERRAYIAGLVDGWVDSEMHRAEIRAELNRLYKIEQYLVLWLRIALKIENARIWWIIKRRNFLNWWRAS